MTARLIPSLGLSLLLSVFASAASTERLLIPVFYNGPGVGATWRTDLIVNNLTSQALDSPGLSWHVECVIPEGCLSGGVGPEEFGLLLGPQAPHGLILYVPPADASGKVVFSAHVAALPRDARYYGTELPVVRESAFTANRIDLPYITITDSPTPVRAMLRVYALDLDSGTVRIDFSNWFTPLRGVPYSTQLQLVRPPDGATPPVFPAYADLDLSSLGHVVGGVMNVHVTPQGSGDTPAPRIWAFVTVTSGATNEVTTITPN